MYRRFVNVYVNGLRRGAIYEDVQQPGGDTIREFFADKVLYVQDQIFL